MNRSQRNLFTMLLALLLLGIPVATLAYSMRSGGSGSMGNMPGMVGGVMPTATATTRADGSAGTGRRVQVAGGSYGEVSLDELRPLLAGKDFTLINVHVPYEGELAKTDAFIPYDAIAGDARLPTDRNAAIVLYCRTGRMSAEAATTLVGLGYRNVRHLAGGMEAWQAQGYPIQTVPGR